MTREISENQEERVITIIDILNECFSHIYMFLMYDIY